MKRAIPLILLLLVLLPLPVKRAGAETGGYAVVPTEEIWFYREENTSSGLFLLPYSYCVRILEEGELFHRVQYGGRDGLPAQEGYCLRSDLLPIDFEPAHPCFVHTVTLTYRLENAPEGEAPPEVLEREAWFYGYYPQGSTRLLRVLLDGEWLLVNQRAPIDIPATNYLPSTEQPVPPKPEGALSPAAIAALCVLSAGAIAIAVLVVRGKRSPKPSSQDNSDLF